MSYRWTISGGTITTGGTSGLTESATNSISYVAGAIGTLTLTCAEINAAGTPSAAGMATVPVIAAPAPPAIHALTPISAGLGADAYVGASPGMTYRWTVSNGTITSAGGAAGVGDDEMNSITYTPGTAGTLTLSCAAINAAGTASEPGTGTVSVIAAQDGVLDCAWLHSRNCWKTTVAAAKACNPGSEGTFSADRRTCSFDSGEKASFAMPFTDSLPYNFSIGTCLNLAQPDVYNIRLTTRAGIVATHVDTGLKTLKVTCPDGAFYVADLSSQTPLLGCNWGEALLPDTGVNTEPYGQRPPTSFYVRGADGPPASYLATLWTCH